MRSFKSKGKNGIEYRSVWKDLKDGSLGSLSVYLGKMFHCERICTFEQTEEDLYSCTDEWCADTIHPLKENMQHLTWIEMMPWIEAHKPGNVTIIENVSSIKKTNPELYKALKVFDAETVVTGQLTYRGEDPGFWLVVNPPLENLQDVAAVFQTFFYLVGNLFHNKDTIEQLKDIGFTDKLTGAFNRNALTHDSENFRQGASLAILFVDLNGMKEINDTEGHDAGDRLLINTCSTIREVFPPETLYRIGGDEFLVVASGLRKDEFMQSGELLRTRLKKNMIEAAMGIAFCENYKGDFKALKDEADELMYKDKRSSYKTFEREEEELSSSRPDELLEVYPQEDGYRVLYCVPHKYEGRGGRIKTGIFSSHIREMADQYVHPVDKYMYLNFWNLSSLISKLEKKSEQDSVIAKFRIRTVDGLWCWVEEQITMIRRDKNKLVLISSLRDISDQRPREDITENKTGSSKDYIAQKQVYLNKMFNDRADKWLAERAEGETVVVITCNLGHLRLYNDTFGRPEGDKMLALTQNAVSKGEALLHGISAYLGSDNFCLIGLLDGYKDVEEFASYLRDNLREYRMEGGFAPAIGIYMSKERKETFATMHDRSLIALSSVKDDYKEHVHIYSQSDFQTEIDSSRIEVHEIQEALAAGGFSCYLQPVVDAEQGKVIGCEALARWTRGVRILKADSFMDILEDSGYILALDIKTWRLICSWQKGLADRGIQQLPCSMNISAVDFHYVKVAETLIGLVNEYELDPNLLVIELSEKTYADDPDNISFQIDLMRSAGLRVFMDDKGGGFDSFRMLYGTKLDGIKMDRSYLQMLPIAGQNINPIRSLINIGKANGMMVISEGAETKEQIKALRNVACRYIQGNGYYRPMSFADYEKILRSQMEEDD